MPKNADVNLILYKAVLDNNYQEAKRLIEKCGAKPVSPEGFEPPLLIAVGHSNQEMLRLLIQAGADLTDRTPIVTAAHQAIYTNDWSLVAVFTEKKYPPEAAKYGHALVEAIAKKQYSIVDTLLQAGLADSQINYPKDCSGSHSYKLKYSLQIACEANDLRMIYLLRSHGVTDKDSEAYKYATNKRDFNLAFALTCKDTALEYEKLTTPNNASGALFSTQQLGKSANEVSGPSLMIYQSSKSRKEDLLLQILESKGEQRQQALLECLLPETYYGKIFHLKRGLFAPALNRGTLNEIVTALNKENLQLKNMDTKLRDSLLSNSEVKRHCPKLFGDIQQLAQEQKRGNDVQATSQRLELPRP